MQSILASFLILALSSGCMSAPIKTSAETVRGIRKIAVVPMEAPPLEVGLLNYSLYRDHMILQVMLRLVDPGTGRVLGRARQTDLARIEQTDSLFAENGKMFKDLFSDMGGKLVDADLITIGLQPG